MISATASISSSVPPCLRASVRDLLPAFVRQARQGGWQPRGAYPPEPPAGFGGWRGGECSTQPQNQPPPRPTLQIPPAGYGPNDHSTFPLPSLPPSTSSALFVLPAFPLFPPRASRIHQPPAPFTVLAVRSLQLTKGSALTKTCRFISRFAPNSLSPEDP